MQAGEGSLFTSGADGEAQGAIEADRADHVVGDQGDRADALDHRVNAHVFWYPGFHGFLAMPARVLWTCPGQSLPYSGSCSEDDLRWWAERIGE